VKIKTMKRRFHAGLAEKDAFPQGDEVGQTTGLTGLLLARFMSPRRGPTHDADAVRPLAQR